MAEKKQARKPRKQTVLYKDGKYEVLERTDTKVCITDGVIHFWVNAQNITEA